MLFHLIYVLIAGPANSEATELYFQVRGIRGSEIYQTSLAPESNESVGNFSNRVLTKALQQQALTQYQGEEAGVHSINQLGSALEVLSNKEMNAYGWCYDVDGRNSNRLASQYPLKGTEQSLVWYYAYAHLEGDNWTSMCVPADHFPPQN